MKMRKTIIFMACMVILSAILCIAGFAAPPEKAETFSYGVATAIQPDDYAREEVIRDQLAYGLRLADFKLYDGFYIYYLDNQGEEVYFENEDTFPTVPTDKDHDNPYIRAAVAKDYSALYIGAYIEDQLFYFDEDGKSDEGLTIAVDFANSGNASDIVYYTIYRDGRMESSDDTQFQGSVYNEKLQDLNQDGDMFKATVYRYAIDIQGMGYGAGDKIGFSASYASRYAEEDEDPEYPAIQKMVLSDPNDTTEFDDPATWGYFTLGTYKEYSVIAMGTENAAIVRCLANIENYTIPQTVSDPDVLGGKVLNVTSFGYFDKDVNATDDFDVGQGIPVEHNQFIKTVTVPPYVKEIGVCGFRSNTITTITFEGDSIELKEEAFYLSRALKTVTLPDSLTEYPKMCFRSSGLESFTIPANIINIGEDAFYACKNLSSVTISEGVQTIGASAFYGCNKLLDVTIPETVVNIGPAAFFDCADRVRINVLNKDCRLSTSCFSSNSPEFAVYGTPGGSLQNDCATLVYTFYCIGTHDMGEWTTEIEATVNTGDGSKTRQCTLCDYLEREVVEWPNPFSDVKPVAWYYNAVKDCFTNKLFSGTSATTFQPDLRMSRAMFCTVLSNLSGEDPATAEKAPFTDVPATEWYAKPINWAYENGIVRGKSTKIFDPNGNITRQEICLMLQSYSTYMMIELKDEDNGVTFLDDAKIADWARAAVMAMKNNGVINGIPTNGGMNFDPTGLATRSQGAVILSGFSKLK